MQKIAQMTRMFAASAAGLFCVALISGCGTDDPVTPGNTQIIVPATYTFNSRFDQSKSSVNYNAQVVRNLLIQDLENRMVALGQPGATAITMQDMLALYEHSDGANLQSTTGTGFTPPLQRQYNLIAAGQNLSGNIAGSQLVNLGQTSDQLIRALFQTLVLNSQDATRRGTPMAYTTDEGIDISQFITTLLYGAVSYYQATSVYLNDLSSKDNTAQDNGAGAPATAQEHAWDAAFGCFGAARDYNVFTDAKLAGPVDDYVFDADHDDRIDFASEYNFPFARYAGARDNGHSTDFTKTIFDAWLDGRATIAGEGAATRIAAQQTIVRNTWENIIGASLIHYINKMRNHIEALTEDSKPENSAEMNKDWAVMKALALSLQFNPTKRISDQDLQIVHNYLENQPQYFPPGTPEYSAYHSRLGLARTIIQNNYAFSGADVNGW